MKYWNMFRNNDEDVYLRRYRCPKCNTYSLRIEHDGYAECEEEECVYDGEEVLGIIENNDFEGYFTEEEIEENFIDINDEVENIINHIIYKDYNYMDKSIENKFNNLGEQLGNNSFDKKKKIGRNSPCICGSGKKYKKCCGVRNPLIENERDEIVKDRVDFIVAEFLEVTKNLYYHNSIVDLLINKLPKNHENLDVIHNSILELIKRELAFFNMSDLIEFSLYCRELFSIGDSYMKNIFSEINCISLLIQKIMLGMNRMQFIKNDIIEHDERFISMLQTILIFHNFISNREYMEVKKIKLGIRELLEEHIYYDEEEEYFKVYDKMPDYILPEEDYDISENLREFLKKKKYTLDENLKKLNYIYKNVLGFNFDELSSVSKYIAQKFNKGIIYILEKDFIEGISSLDSNSISVKIL